MAAPRLIGYWRGDGDSTSRYPDPRDWIDLDWDEDERYDVWAYFNTGTIFRTFMGLSPCRICGNSNGAVEYTDGTYVWPEGLTHYIEEHAVRLPDEVLAHARSRLAVLESLEPTTDWWTAATQTK